MTTLSWPAWGTTAGLTVTDPRALPAAARLARTVLAHAERAADRRAPQADVHRLDRSAGRPVRVSRRLADLVTASLDAARLTDGLVDPTVGNAVTLARALSGAGPGSGAVSGAAGLLWLRRRGPSWAPTCGGSVPPQARPAVGWASVDVDGRYVTVPPHVLLDLTAAARAVTVQHAAEVIARRLGVGAVMVLGGGLATAGPAPDGGWAVLGPLGPLGQGAGLAVVRGPVIDPRTGRPAPRVWASVTVRRGHSEGGLPAATAFALAAAVIGPAAPLWLDEHGVRRDARELIPASTRPPGASVLAVIPGPAPAPARRRPPAPAAG